MTSNAPQLWHYTCDDGMAAVGRRGFLVPQAFGLVWLTDLDRPVPDALGLTSTLLSCDRTRHRYRVADDDYCVPWMEVRRDRPVLVDYLEVPGTLPRHWWVSSERVPVVLDEVRP